LTLALFALAVGQGAVWAQGADSRIAVVHMQELVEGSPDFQRASEQWSLALSERTAQVQELREQLREAQTRLTATDAVDGDSARAELVAEIERLQAQIERMSTDVQTDLNALRAELLAPVVEKMNQLARTWAEEHGIDVLIDTSRPNLGLTLAIQDIEITDDLLEMLEREEEEEAVGEPVDTDPDPPGDQ
jgi:Skp family chaperone for outer membrane proteins